MMRKKQKLSFKFNTLFMKYIKSVNDKIISLPNKSLKKSLLKQQNTYLILSLKKKKV